MKIKNENLNKTLPEYLGKYLFICFMFITILIAHNAFAVNVCMKIVTSQINVDGVVASSISSPTCPVDPVWYKVEPHIASPPMPTITSNLYLAYYDPTPTNTTNNDSRLLIGVDTSGDEDVSNFDILLFFFDADNNNSWNDGDFAIRIMVSPSESVITSGEMCDQNTGNITYYEWSGGDWTEPEGEDDLINEIETSYAYDYDPVVDPEDHIWNLEIDMPVRYPAGGSTFFDLNTSSPSYFGMGVYIFADYNHQQIQQDGNVLTWPAGLTSSITSQIPDISFNTPQLSVPLFHQLADINLGVCRPALDLALVLDFSDSMYGSVGCGTVPLAKYEVIKNGITAFIEDLKVLPHHNEDRIGVVFFRSDIDPPGGPDMVNISVGNLENNLEDIKNAVNAESPSGYTALGGAVLKTVDAIDPMKEKKHMIILSDGIQNVNPLIMHNDDMGSDRYCERHIIYVDNPILAWGGDSGIPGRPDVYLQDFGIHMHTLTIGPDGSQYEELLANISNETSGIHLNTCDPDEEWEEFLLNCYIEAAEGNTIELVGFETGTIQQGCCCFPHYRFPINGSVTRAVFMLSWTSEPDETGHLNIRIFTPKGFEVPLENYETQGDSFHQAVFDFPMLLPSHPYKPLDYVGEWEVVIEPELTGSAPVFYRVYLLVDDAALEYDFSVDKTVVLTGRPIPLHIRVTEGEKPLKPSSIEVYVLKPRIGFGTIIANANITYPLRARIASGYGNIEIQSSPLMQIYEAVFQIPEYVDLSTPLRERVILFDDGLPEHGDAVSEDGTYSALYNNTLIPGEYEFTFSVQGESEFHGPYHRIKTCSAMVMLRDQFTPHFEIGIIDLLYNARGGIFQVVVTPSDLNGNHLGPGYAEKINISISNAVAVSELEDQLDGSYVQKFSINNFSDIETSNIIIFNEQLTLPGLAEKVRIAAKKKEKKGPVPFSWCCFYCVPCYSAYQLPSLINWPYYTVYWPNLNFQYQYGYSNICAQNPSSCLRTQFYISSPTYSMNNSNYLGSSSYFYSFKNPINYSNYPQLSQPSTYYTSSTWYRYGNLRQQLLKPFSFY